MRYWIATVVLAGVAVIGLGGCASSMEPLNILKPSFSYLNDTNPVPGDTVATSR